VLHTTIVALVLSFLTLAVGACGKSSKADNIRTQAIVTPTTATEPIVTTGPPNPEINAGMVDRANRLCNMISARRASEKTETQQQVAQMYDKLASFERSIVAEMSALTPTGSTLISAWRQIVRDREAIVTDNAKIGELAGLGQLQTKATTSLIAQRETTEAHAFTLAKHASITECATSVWLIL
jgi:hypothetical protein